MKRTVIFSILFLIFLAHSVLVSQYRFDILPEDLEPQNAQGFYDYKGATHVLTTKSAGSGSFTEVVHEAQEAGLDFIFFTDLNDFSQDLTLERYHQNLAVFVGGLYSYLDSRILSFETSHRNKFDSIGTTQTTLADALSQKSFDDDQSLLVLAHPFKSGFSWSGPYPSGLHGLEIMNLKTVWQKSWLLSHASTIWSGLIYPFNSQLSLVRLYEEPTEELELWDSLSVKQKMFGFVGVEATAKTAQIGNFSLKFPSYATSFSIASNHILLNSELTGNYEVDRPKILKAIHNGQFYMSLDLLANPKGFVSYLLDGEKQIPMGSQVRLRPGMKLVLKLPKEPLIPFETILYKNGLRILHNRHANTEFIIKEPGVYRFVVRVIPKMPLPDAAKWIDWIYTNPFFVTDDRR